MKRLVGLLGICLLVASGCMSGRVYRPAGCDSPVGLSGRIHDCQECGDQPCDGHAGYSLKQIIASSVSCGSGCGEVYWGEWYSDPPDACDPCDDQQNWIGRSYGKRPLFWRFQGMKGGRFHENCDCADCQGGHSFGEETIIESEGEPTMAEPPKAATENDVPGSTTTANQWSARRVGFWQLSGRKDQPGR